MSTDPETINAIIREVYTPEVCGGLRVQFFVDDDDCPALAVLPPFSAADLPMLFQRLDLSDIAYDRLGEPIDRQIRDALFNYRSIT